MNSTEKKEFLKRCENKAFNSIQEATKEIAYIAFMNKQNICQNKQVEFSAKVDFSMQSRIKDNEISTDCFENLEKYINKK